MELVQASSTEGSPLDPHEHKESQEDLPLGSNQPNVGRCR